LARESPTDHVYWLYVSVHLAHVRVLHGIGPVLAQDASAPFILLAVPHGATSGGTLDPKVEAANAAEQRADL